MAIAAASNNVSTPCHFVNVPMNPTTVQPSRLLCSRMSEASIDGRNSSGSTPFGMMMNFSSGISYVCSCSRTTSETIEILEACRSAALSQRTAVLSKRRRLQFFFAHTSDAFASMTIGTCALLPIIPPTKLKTESR